MSLRVLIIAILTVLGLLAASIAVFESYSLRESSERAQLKTLSRVIKISSDEILRQTYDFMAEVAAGTQIDKGFKKAAGRLIKDPGSEEDKQSVVKYLNDQFHQKMVTAGIIKLTKVRIYDLDLQMVAESSEGAKNFKSALPDGLYAQAKPREGADRLKILNTIWSSEDGAMVSVLAPVGGLRLLGYMEVIANPVHNLRSLQNMMGIPVTMLNTKEETLFQSESWEKVQSDSTLTVTYDLLDEKNMPALRIQALENLQSMYDDVEQTEMLVATVFIVVFGLGLTVSIITMKKFVFSPMSIMVQNLKQVASGDMRISVNTNEFIREIKSVNDGLNHVVNNLSHKLLEISDIGNLLNESSQELAVQANRSVASANQQTNSVGLLLTATQKLVESSEAVHQNAVATALTSSDADEKTIEGQKIIAQAEASMSKMSGQIRYSMESITTLKDNIANIDSILENIQTIAEQTNLLALNAAIESARAGENGRGFAVVADEVRQLAGRTQHATQEVVKVLNGLTKGAEVAVEAMTEGQSFVEESVVRVQEARSALEEITANVSEITDMNAVIVAAANSQTSISTDNKNGIDSLSEVASQVALDAENLTARSTSLADMSKQLELLVSTFKFKKAM